MGKVLLSKSTGASVGQLAVCPAMLLLGSDECDQGRVLTTGLRGCRSDGFVTRG